jgi:hypothetical protein
MNEDLGARSSRRGCRRCCLLNFGGTSAFFVRGFQIDPAQRVGPHASEAASAVLHASTPLHLVELLVGLLCSMLGGYVAAAIANRHERLNGTLSCYLCVGIGILSVAVGLSKDPLWQQALLLPASPACAFVGGDLRLRQVTSRNVQPAV